MSDWLKFDYDPFTGITEWLRPREGPGLHFDMAYQQDVEPIIEAAKQEFNHGLRSKEFRKMATIPPIVEMLWRKKYGIDIYNPNHREGVKRLLNDPAWSYLRTAPGKI